MSHLIYTLVILAIGFGLGRTKHFDKLFASVKNFVVAVKARF